MLAGVSCPSEDNIFLLPSPLPSFLPSFLSPVDEKSNGNVIRSISHFRTGNALEKSTTVVVTSSNYETNPNLRWIRSCIFSLLISTFHNCSVSLITHFFISSMLSLLLPFPLLLRFLPRTFLSPNFLRGPDYFYSTAEQLHEIFNFTVSLMIYKALQALVS
jgi:hypothetical protein